MLLMSYFVLLQKKLILQLSPPGIDEQASLAANVRTYWTELTIRRTKQTTIFACDE